MTDCLFCRIIAGDIPCDMVFESELLVAFRDIAPKAPVHVLVVPRLHVENVAALAATAPDTLAALTAAAQSIADAESDGQFRLMFNTGEAAGQTVFHVHAHVLGRGSVDMETV